MGNEAVLKGRVINKHDIEANWIKAKGFIPKAGEPIVYDAELDAEGNAVELPEGRTQPYSYARMKIGDGVTEVNELSFFSEIHSTDNIYYNNISLTTILDTYVLNIDPELFDFDTDEIIFTTSELGKATLGDMVLG